MRFRLRSCESFHPAKRGRTVPWPEASTASDPDAPPEVEPNARLEPRKSFISHMHPAVNLQNLPCDVAGGGRGEEGDDLGDVFGGPEPPEGDLSEELLLGLVAQLVGHRGDDEAGGLSEPAGEFCSISQLSDWLCLHGSHKIFSIAPVGNRAPDTFFRGYFPTKQLVWA